MFCADECMPELELQTGPATIVFIELAEKIKKRQKIMFKEPWNPPLQYFLCR